MKHALTNMAIKKAADGRHEDGGGLRLVKTGDRGKWVYRYTFLGRRREMGLGAWPEVSLAQARQTRDGWAAEIAAGRDPITVRQMQDDEAKLKRDRLDPTFADLVDMVFEGRKETLKADGAAGRWRSPLDLYIIPAFGQMRVSQISQFDLHAALKPIWRTMHPTAIKALRRVRICLKEARAMRFEADVEACEAVKSMLGAVDHKPVPIPATPWQRLPELFCAVGDRTQSAQALRFLMLTCVRMEAGRGARLDEIEGDIWTVPAERVKGRRGKVEPFRVPLSAPAMEIVQAARECGEEWLFPGLGGRGPITNVAIEKRMASARMPGKPHGFRSSFRMWVQETDACSWEVAETVLGHAIGNQVERTYARSDLIDKRRVVMNAWGGS